MGSLAVVLMTCLSAFSADLDVIQGAPQNAPTVLRISAGPHGSDVNGTFKLDEERSRFDPTTDKDVVVLFQWDGIAGPHRLGVTWRSPDGSQSSSSAIDYIAKDRRFGAYWSLPLKPSMSAGMWSVEATVDGQPAGRFTFEIAPADMRAAVMARRPLATADMFARLTSIFVMLDRQSAKGEHLDPAASLAHGRQRMTTSMAALDGADRIDAVLPDGSRQTVETIQTFNRNQDWAVISGGPTGEVAVPLAAGGSTKVGDRCFSMEGAASGSRVLLEGAITGLLNAPNAGPRLLVQWNNGTGTPGAPVLNELGEVIGIVGGSLVPGTSSVGELLHFRTELRGVPDRAAIDGATSSRSGRRQSGGFARAR